jgi:hypothetical protein
MFGKKKDDTQSGRAGKESAKAHVVETGAKDTSPKSADALTPRSAARARGISFGQSQSTTIDQVDERARTPLAERMRAGAERVRASADRPDSPSGSPAPILRSTPLNTGDEPAASSDPAELVREVGRRVRAHWGPEVFAQMWPAAESALLVRVNHELESKVEALMKEQRPSLEISICERLAPLVSQSLSRELEAKPLKPEVRAQIVTEVSSALKPELEAEVRKLLDASQETKVAELRAEFALIRADLAQSITKAGAGAETAKRLVDEALQAMTQALTQQAALSTRVEEIDKAGADTDEAVESFAARLLEHKESIEATRAQVADLTERHVKDAEELRRADRARDDTITALSDVSSKLAGRVDAMAATLTEVDSTLDALEQSYAEYSERFGQVEETVGRLAQSHVYGMPGEGASAAGELFGSRVDKVERDTASLALEIPSLVQRAVQSAFKDSELLDALT